MTGWPPNHRRTYGGVTRVPTLTADDPSSIMRDIVPEEAMATAVVVAATRPDGDIEVSTIPPPR